MTIPSLKIPHAFIDKDEEHVVLSMIVHGSIHTSNVRFISP